MRVLLVGDFRSTLARGWVAALPESIEEVVLFSTREAVPVSDSRVVAFSSSADPVSRMKTFLAGKRQTRTAAYMPHLSTPHARRLSRVAAEVGGARAMARRVRTLIDSYAPQVVHGMRIPFEGIAAATALGSGQTPLALSIWGNDLTLHASRSRWVGRLTRQALGLAAGLHADCERDAELARHWGLPEDARTVVVPTNGGVDERIFSPGAPTWARLGEFGIPHDRPLIVNPRGLRAYVRTDVFIDALDLVRRQVPDVLGVAVGVDGHLPSQKLMDDLDLGAHLLLLPTVDQEVLADIFRVALVSVSPSTHDGTPNSLLEAMACGAFPVVSNLASTREWVEHGSNGLLFDPGNAEELASLIVLGIRDDDLRRRACELNTSTISTTASRSSCAARISRWYQGLVAGAPV